MAGKEGIEPSSPDLESGILPLNYFPKENFFMGNKLKRNYPIGPIRSYWQRNTMPMTRRYRRGV